MTITDAERAASVQRMRDAAGTKDPSTLPFSCRCGARWGGYRTAHCAAAGCHRTFSGETTFSRHRRDGRCLNPAEVGMSLVPGRPYDCWGYPGDNPTDTTEES